MNSAAAIVAGVSWDTVDDDEFCDRTAAVYGWGQFRTPVPRRNGRTTRLFMSAVAQTSNRSLDFAAIRRHTFVQGAAFSRPDLDHSEPDHKWIVPSL